MLTFLSECTKGSRMCFLQPEPVPDLVLQQWLCPSAHSNSHFPDLSNPFVPQLLFLFLSFLFFYYFLITFIFIFIFFATRQPTKRRANCWCNFPGREENVGGKWKETCSSFHHQGLVDAFSQGTAKLFAVGLPTQGIPLPVAGEILSQYLCSSLGILSSLQRMARKPCFLWIALFLFLSSYPYLKWNRMEEKMLEKTGQLVVQSCSPN